jgi:ankyrin repeat protein
MILNVDPNVLNIQDKFLKTAAHYAAIHNHVGIIQKILDIDPEVLNVKDQSDKTPLHYAIEGSCIEVIKELLKNDHIIDKDYGITALHYAIQQGKVDVVAAILKQTPSCINDQDTYFGNSAMHYAIESCNINIAQMISEKIDNIDIKNRDGKTALHLAVESAVQTIDRTIVETLLKKGAKINIKDKYKKSPMEYLKEDSPLADLFRNSSLGM